MNKEMIEDRFDEHYEEIPIEEFENDESDTQKEFLEKFGKQQEESYKNLGEGKKRLREMYKGK